jgi:hypothetical protein
MAFIIDKILAGAYPLANIILILFAFLLCVIILKKPLVKGIKVMFEEYFATKKDIQSIRTNEFFHTNKAILLLSKGLVADTKPELYKRIQDTILETTPDDQKNEIKDI